MTRTRRLIVAGAVLGSMLGSGVAGATIVAALNSPAAITLAATNTPASGAATQSPNQSQNGKSVSNEDPTHEKNESAAREAQEDSGQVADHSHDGKPNEDPTHEKNESAAREAQENAGQSQTPAK